MDFLKRFLAGAKSDNQSPAAKVPGKLSEKEIADLTNAYLKENPDPDHDVCKSASGQQILGLDRDQQTQFTLALVYALHESDGIANGFVAKLPTQHERINVHRVPGWAGIWTPRRVLYKMFEALLAKKLPIGITGTIAIARWCADSRGLSSYHYPINQLASQEEDIARNGQLNQELREALAGVVNQARARSFDSEIRKFGDRLETALGGNPQTPIRPGEVWADTAISDLAALQWTSKRRGRNFSGSASPVAQRSPRRNG